MDGWITRGPDPSTARVEAMGGAEAYVAAAAVQGEREM